jgi:hypothetical protein
LFNRHKAMLIFLEENPKDLRLKTAFRFGFSSKKIERTIKDNQPNYGKIGMIGLFLETYFDGIEILFFFQLKNKNPRKSNRYFFFQLKK